MQDEHVLHEHENVVSESHLTAKKSNPGASTTRTQTGYSLGPCYYAVSPPRTMELEYIAPPSSFQLLRYPLFSLSHRPQTRPCQPVKNKTASLRQLLLQSVAVGYSGYFWDRTVSVCSVQVSQNKNLDPGCIRHLTDDRSSAMTQPTRTGSANDYFLGLNFSAQAGHTSM